MFILKGCGVGLWVYESMGLWVCGSMGLWVYESMGLIMGLWVYGSMGLWVYGPNHGSMGLIMGLWVYCVLGPSMRGYVGLLSECVRGSTSDPMAGVGVTCFSLCIGRDG